MCNTMFEETSDITCSVWMLVSWADIIYILALPLSHNDDITLSVQETGRRSGIRRRYDGYECLPAVGPDWQPAEDCR